LASMSNQGTNFPAMTAIQLVFTQHSKFIILHYNK
jgi:hypothetical protein